MPGTVTIHVEGKPYKVKWGGEAPPSQFDIEDMERGIRAQVLGPPSPGSPAPTTVQARERENPAKLDIPAMKAVLAASQMGKKAGGVRSAGSRHNPETPPPVKVSGPPGGRTPGSTKSLTDYAKAAESGKASAFVDQQPRGTDGAKQIKARAKKQFDSVMTPEMVRRALLLTEIEKRAAERSSVGFGETEGAYKAGNTQEQQLAAMIEAERKVRAQKALDPLRGPAMALQGMARMPGDLLSPLATSANPEMQRAILADAVKQAMAQGMDPQQASQAAQQKATEFARFQGQTLMNALQTVGAFAPQLAPFASGLNTAVLNPSLAASVGGAGVDPRLTLQQKLGQLATVAGPIAGMKALPMIMRGLQAGARGVRGLVENFQPTDAIKRASGYEPEFIQRYSASGKDKGASKIYNYDPAGAPFGFVPPEPAPVNTPALPGPAAKAPKAKATPTPKPSAPEPVSPVEQAYKEAVGEVDTPVRASTETTPGTPPGASTVQANEGPVTRAGAKKPPAPKAEKPVQVPTQPQPLGKAPWEAVRTKNPLTGKQEGFDTEDQLREYESIKEGHRRTMKGLEARQQEGEDVSKDVRTAEDKLRRDLTQFWTRKKQAAGQASGIEPDLDRAFAEAVGDEPKPAAKPVKTPMTEIRTVADGSKNRAEGNGLRGALTDLDRIMKRFQEVETSLRTRQATLATAKPKDRKAIQDEINGLQETHTQLTLIGKQKRKAVEVEYATLARDYPDVIEAARTTPASTVLSPTPEVQKPAKVETAAPVVSESEGTAPSNDTVERLTKSLQRWVDQGLDKILPDEYGRYQSILERMKAGEVFGTKDVTEEMIRAVGAKIRDAAMAHTQEQKAAKAERESNTHQTPAKAESGSTGTAPEPTKPAPSNEQQIEPEPVKHNQDVPVRIGHNAFGYPLYEDGRGIRTYVKNGEHHAEKPNARGRSKDFLMPQEVKRAEAAAAIGDVEHADGWGGIHPNSRTKFDDAWTKRDPKAMAELLDPMNKVMRAEFEKRSGTKLPKTISGTDQAVKDYFKPSEPTQLAEEPTQLADEPTQLPATAMPGSDIEKANRGKTTVLAEGAPLDSSRIQGNIRLIHRSKGYHPAGSMARYLKADQWAVEYGLKGGGGMHGKVFSSEEDARHRFDSMVAPQNVPSPNETTATISEEPSNDQRAGDQVLQNPVPGDREPGTRPVGSAGDRTLEVEPAKVSRVPDEPQQPQGSRSDSGTQREADGRDASEPGNRPIHSEGTGDEGVHSPGSRTSIARGQNFIIPDANTLHTGSLKQKFKDNVAAIEMLRRLSVEGRLPTPEDQAILAKFVGWGAMPGAFNRYHPDAGDWTAERDIIQKLLSPEEYDAGAKSTLNAHYTAGPIVEGMWRMATRMGVNAKNLHILEPSMGAGNFFGLLPESLRSAKATGVELDTLTGRIAQMLYPQYNVLVRGFETVKAPDGFFDLAIGNVPFGDYRIHDKRYAGIKDARIHDYFFLKSLDKVRPGGLVMFITSTGTMDKVSPAVREAIAARADLVAAFRLPDGAFKANAGTQVVTDLIILKRREDGVAPSGPSWLSRGRVPDPGGGEDIPINEYYIAHPENVLGTIDRKGTMYNAAGSPHVSITDDFDERWQRAISSLPEGVFEARSTERAQPGRAADQATKNNAYVINEGKLFINQGGELIAANLPPKQEQIVKASMKVAEEVRQLIRLTVGGAPVDQIEKQRGALSDIYDAFVKRFGYLNATENVAAFDGDPDAAVIRSLEIWDKKTKKARKADIFSKDTIRHTVKATSAGSAGEALGISLNESGVVDVDRIAELLKTTSKAVESKLTAEGLAFSIPGEARWEPAFQYLSGNVRKKLELAQAAADLDDRFAPNVAALAQVQPKDIPYDELSPRMGVPWIGPMDIEAFAASLFNSARSPLSIGYVPSTGEWLVDWRNDDFKYSAGSTKVFGTERAPLNKIIESALNNRPIQVRDPAPDDDKKTVPNKDETDAANMKVEALHERFEDWVWSDMDRRERLHRFYNDNFNNIVPTEFNGSHLTFQGMNPHITLREHQVNAVWRTIVTGNALYAHEVGTGKTWTIVAAAMEMKRMRLARKPAIAVLKATLPGFLREAKELYPNARILAVENFDAKSRKTTVSQIAMGDWDMVILTHDNLDMLPMSADTQAEFINKEMRELEAIIIEQMAEAESKGGKKTGNRLVKRLENAKAKLETRLKEALDGRKDDAIVFEETGIDALFVDEAHKYKALPVYTRMDRVKGVPTSRSDRATQMWMRTRWIQRMNRGRGVVFATGTPVTNTMAELYTMQRYLQGDSLIERGIMAFDPWSRTFGIVQTKIEPGVTGDFKAVASFSQFSNLPELVALTSEVIDVKRATEMPNIKRPKKVETVTAVPSTDAQARFQAELSDRAEEIKGKPPEPGGDNMLAISTDGRKAALDMRLVDRNATAADSLKVPTLIKAVLANWKSEPTSTQMIFCDMGVHPNEWGFSVYEEIINNLVKGGIPREKILNFATLTDAQRKTASEMLKSGKVLVGIGSTDKMGTGVNAQDHLHYLHHLDVPWMPGLLEQRDGRGYRQGNRHADIQIIRYVTEGSFDSFMWSKIDKKSRFIAQFIDSASKGTDIARTIVDEDTEELSPAEVQAIATGNPLILEKANLEDDVKKLNAAKRRHQRDKVDLEARIKDIDRAIEFWEDKRAHLERRLATVQAAPATDGKQFRIVIKGKEFRDRDEAQEAIQNLPIRAMKDRPESIGEFRGLPLTAWTTWVNGNDSLWVGIDGSEIMGGSLYNIEAKARPSNIESSIGDADKTLKQKKQDLATAKTELAAPFRKQAELEEKSARLAEVLAELMPKSEGGASKQAGAIFPRGRKLPKGHVPKGDYPLATRVGLSIYRSGKTSLKDFRAAAIEKIGGWIEKESGLLWKTVRQLDIEEPAHLGEHLKTATRPKRDKTMLDWLSEAFFTTGHRAAQARGYLETAWGMKKGSLVGSSEDIEAAINRMTRLGGKIESTVLRGFMDADGNRITKGLPEIQADLKKAKVEPEDFQVFMRAMRENSISRRPGNIAIGPERVMANEVAIEMFREKYKGKEEIISRAAADFMNFADEHLRMFETYGLRPEGWADGIREMNPIYWPLFEAQSPEDLAMQDVAPGARGSGEIDLKQVKGGKRYADGWATMAQQVERVIRAGEMSKAFTPFLEESAKHPLMQWIAKDITEEVETKRMLEKQRRMGVVTDQEMNALDGDLQAQKDLDEMMAQMLKDVDLNNDAIIVTYKDGEKRYWKMDPYLWAATKGAAPEQFNGVLQVLRFFAGLNRGLTTKYNPLFAFVFNPMIDVVSATAQHGMNPLQFFKGLYHSARGEKSALYRKALQNEVFFNSRGMRDFLEQQWVFEGGEKATAIRALADKLLALKFVQFANRASQTMEEATRLGMFAQMEKAYRKRGLSPEEATRRASDDSANLMNFGEAGGMGRSFSRWGVPFANVTSQVIMSAYRGYRRSPMKFLLRLVALITIPKLIEYFLYKDDDEYKRMPNYAKDGTLMFKRGPGDWLAIRIPQELGMVFAGIPRRALEARAGTKTTGEAAGDQASELAQMLMPRALPTLGASALQAGTYMASGRTYDLRFGVREQYGDNKGYEQAKQQAATLLGSLGKMGVEYTGYLTGNEEKLPALLQRYAPRPGRPTNSVEGPARAEWLRLRNPDSYPQKRKKKGGKETDAEFADRIRRQNLEAKRILEAKMKESGWDKKSDDEKRKALAKAGVAGMKTD